MSASNKTTSFLKRWEEKRKLFRLKSLLKLCSHTISKLNTVREKRNKRLFICLFCMCVCVCVCECVSVVWCVWFTMYVCLINFNWIGHHEAKSIIDVCLFLFFFYKYLYLTFFCCWFFETNSLLLNVDECYTYIYKLYTSLHLTILYFKLYRTELLV